MELRPSVHHRLGVLGHTAPQLLHGAVVVRPDCVRIAHGNTPAAAHAFVVVNGGLPLPVVGNGVVGALKGALAAADTVFLGYRGLACRVLLHLAPAASAAHAQVFHRAAKAGLLVSLEVAQGKNYVGLHNGLADFGGLNVLRSGYRNLHIVVAPQAVADDNLTAGAQGREAVLKGGVQVLQSVLSPSGIEGVAVGEEGQAPHAPHHIGHHLGVIGPQEGQIARLSKVHLNGGELSLKVNLANPRRADEPLQLLQQISPRPAPQVGKIYLRRFHCVIPPMLRRVYCFSARPPGSS